jgi:hypothetical protein
MAAGAPAHPNSVTDLTADSWTVTGVAVPPGGSGVPAPPCWHFPISRSAASTASSMRSGNSGPARNHPSQDDAPHRPPEKENQSHPKNGLKIHYPERAVVPAARNHHCVAFGR